jgi:hypothetical protein
LQSAPPAPRPGPIRCERCGTAWGDDAAFLPLRSVVREGVWAWVCVRCAELEPPPELGGLPGRAGADQSPENSL